MNPIADGDRAVNSSAASLVISCAVLTLALAIAGLASALYGRYVSGQVGVWASLIATGICWVSGCTALVISFCGQKFGLGVQGVLGSMAVRMGVPLVGGLALHQLNAPLAEAGIFSLVLANYLFMLVVETALSLRFVAPAAKPAAKAA